MSDDFDANRLALDCAAMTLCDRPVLALMAALRRDVTTPPWFRPRPEQTAEDLDQICAELTSRGVDADGLVRFGLADRLARALLTGLAIVDIVDDGPTIFACPSLASWRGTPAPQNGAEGFGLTLSDGGAPPFALDTDHFVAIEAQMIVSGIDPKSLPAGVEARIHDHLTQMATKRSADIQRWIDSAPLADLLRWRLGNMQGGRSKVPQTVANQYRWLIERSTVTYLTQWSAASLYLEWNWLRGTAPPPAPAAVMLQRCCDPIAVDAAIAAGSVPPTSEATTMRQALAQVDDQALQLLTDGRRSEAAALLGAAVNTYPTNPDALNNLGFALLPDDPEGALKLLDRASALGYHQWALNLVNRMQALLLLNRAADAAALATRTLAASAEHSGHPMTGYLWGLDGRGVIVRVTDALAVVYALAERAATRAGAVTEAAEWARRHREACGAVSPDDHRCWALIPQQGEAA